MPNSLFAGSIAIFMDIYRNLEMTEGEVKGCEAAAKISRYKNIKSICNLVVFFKVTILFLHLSIYIPNPSSRGGCNTNHFQQHNLTFKFRVFFF